MTEYIMDRQYDIQRGTFSTVKREKIVRCRDCERWPDDCDWNNDEEEPDGFCAWGERKEGGE